MTSTYPRISDCPESNSINHLPSRTAPLADSGKSGTEVGLNAGSGVHVYNKEIRIGATGREGDSELAAKVRYQAVAVGSGGEKECDGGVRSRSAIEVYTSMTSGASLIT